MKIKKGDTIKVLSGKDKGKQAQVQSVFEKTDTVFVPEINTYKKAVKKSEIYPEGGVLQFSRPIDASKLALICPKCKKQTRVGYKIQANKKYRICKKCSEII